MSYYRCSDRMCGALDCPACHPENFRSGVFYEDELCCECGERVGEERHEHGEVDYLCQRCWEDKEHKAKMEETECDGCGGSWAEYEHNGNRFCIDCLNKRLQLEAAAEGDR